MSYTKYIWFLIVFGGLVYTLHDVSTDVEELSISTWDTYQAAREALPPDTPWLPGWVPDSATNIREVHHLKNEQMWLAFDYAKWQNFPHRHCAEITRAELDMPGRAAISGLAHFVGNDAAAVPHIRYYRCMGRNARFLTVDNLERKAYSWVTAREN